MISHVEFQKIKDEYVAKLYAYMPKTTNLDTEPRIPSKNATIHTCRNLLMTVGYINQPAELALMLSGILQTANGYFDCLLARLDERIVSATLEFITVIKKEFPASSLENWTIDLLNKTDIEQRIASIFEYPEWSDATTKCIVGLESKAVHITVEFKSRELTSEQKAVLIDQLYNHTEYLSEKLIDVRIFVYDKNDFNPKN